MACDIFRDENPSLVIHANSTRVRDLPNSNDFDVIAILMEHLDPLVAKISHQDVVVRVNNEMTGLLDLPSTHNPNKIALRIKDLHPMATFFTHHNISIRQKANTNGTRHLTISIPF